MTRELLWDAGPGETRAGMVEDGTLSEFRIIRPRREKALAQAGELYTVRITQRLDQRQALASFGVGEDGLIAQCTAPEGALIAAEMVRCPIPEPGRWKRAKFRMAEGVSAQSQPGWHFSAEPWVLFLRKSASTLDAIRCPNAGTANEVADILGPAAPPIHVDPEAIELADFDSLIDQAISGDIPIDGGMLSVERTRAMTMIDVDGSGNPVALNLSAARTIPPLLRMLDIGGPVAIDFVSMAGRADRLAVDEALAHAATCLGQHERTATNGFGLCQIIRPRTGPSVPEILCGTRLRQRSNESRAIALLRDAGRSLGHGARHLVAAPAIIDLIGSWPEEIDALRFALGVAIELVPDSGATGYGHVHVGQS